jgi:hypothetical protein
MKSGALDEFDLPEHLGIESTEVEAGKFGIAEIQHVAEFDGRGHLKVPPGLASDASVIASVHCTK